MSEYLTKKELQQMLKLNDRKLNALVRTEGFPVTRIGNEWYINAARFDAWMEQQEGKKVRLDYSEV